MPNAFAADPIRQPGFYRVRLSAGDKVQIARWNREYRYWTFFSGDQERLRKVVAWADDGPIEVAQSAEIERPS
jgi:hypothetical protein